MLIDEPDKKRADARRVYSFFAMTSLGGMVFHRELGMHAFELAVFGLQVAKALHIRCLHATALGLPDIVRRVGNTQLTAHILDLAAALNLLQRGDNGLSVNLLLRIVGLLGAQCAGDLQLWLDLFHGRLTIVR